jgi:hypothetical protein
MDERIVEGGVDVGDTEDVLAISDLGPRVTVVSSFGALDFFGG